MNNRERVYAIFHSQPYDHMPIVHFGFWRETLEKWHREGHISREEWLGWADGNEYDRSIGEKLGFDFNWGTCFCPNTGLFPPFEEKDVGPYPPGGRMVQNRDGVIVLRRRGRAPSPLKLITS